MLGNNAVHYGHYVNARGRYCDIYTVVRVQQCLLQSIHSFIHLICEKLANKTKAQATIHSKANGEQKAINNFTSWMGGIFVLVMILFFFGFLDLQMEFHIDCECIQILLYMLRSRRLANVVHNIYNQLKKRATLHCVRAMPSARTASQNSHTKCDNAWIIWILLVIIGWNTTKKMKMERKKKTWRIHVMGMPCVLRAHTKLKAIKFTHTMYSQHTK